MRLAIDQAELASRLGEIPIGAVVIHEGAVIGAAHNRRELDQDPVAHAEILAIRQAARRLGSWRLLGTTLYVTLEPCAMCAGALVLARVARLVFGCRDPKAGAVRSLYQICDDNRLNHRLEIVEGVEGQRCAELLSGFFEKIRRQNG
ncbi:MAG: nucleoside deaminase [Bradymonadales bacterium]|nr:nucleoside deaminase [Bradymonadales bacterium]